VAQLLDFNDLTTGLDSIHEDQWLWAHTWPSDVDDDLHI
jgi:hypothetical protein